MKTASIRCLECGEPMRYRYAADNFGTILGQRCVACADVSARGSDTWVPRHQGTYFYLAREPLCAVSHCLGKWYAYYRGKYVGKAIERSGAQAMVLRAEQNKTAPGA